MNPNEAFGHRKVTSSTSRKIVFAAKGSATLVCNHCTRESVLQVSKSMTVNLDNIRCPQCGRSNWRWRFDKSLGGVS